MASKPPKGDPVQDAPQVAGPQHAAAGLPAIGHTLRVAQQQMGVRRTALTLLRVNQKDGFDCPGCAWPEPDHRHTAEFCENGAKAVAEEATRRRRRVTRTSSPRTRFADPRLAQRLLAGPAGAPDAPHVPARRRGPLRTGLLGARLRHRRRGDQGALVARRGRLLHLGPHQQRGGVPLPAVRPRAGHEQPARLLEHVPRVLRFRALRDDRHRQGQRAARGPLQGGSDHRRRAEPRHQPPAHALGAGEGEGGRREDHQRQPAARGGPGALQEPADPSGHAQGRGADRPVPADPHRWRPGAVPPAQQADPPDRRSGRRGVRPRTHPRLRGVRRGRPPSRLGRHAHGDRSTREEIEKALGMVLASERTIVCWAMGLTQHKHSVPTIREIVNFLLLRGNIGRPGAGVCPVRGHSNVQGDRTMGIFERPAPAFLDALEKEFGFAPPREHGYDVVRAIRALRDGEAKVFFAWAAATSCPPPRHGCDRGGHAPCPAHRACVDQAEPLARRHRCARPDPAHPRPHRARSAGQRRAVRDRRGLHGHGARLPGPSGARQRPSAVRAGHRVPPGPPGAG